MPCSLANYALNYKGNIGCMLPLQVDVCKEAWCRIYGMPKSMYMCTSLCSTARQVSPLHGEYIHCACVVYTKWSKSQEQTMHSITTKVVKHAITTLNAAKAIEIEAIMWDA